MIAYCLYGLVAGIIEFEKKMTKIMIGITITLMLLPFIIKKMIIFGK